MGLRVPFMAAANHWCVNERLLDGALGFRDGAISAVHFQRTFSLECKLSLVFFMFLLGESVIQCYTKI